MAEEQISSYIDQQRWLLNNGIVSDGMKNQLFFYGSLVHKEVQAVELDIDVSERVMKYRIYVSDSLLSKMDKYKRLSTSTSLFGMWRFQRLLKSEGSLDFQSMLAKFVLDFCGPKWFTKVEVLSFDKYVEVAGAESGDEGDSLQSNKLPD